MRIQDLYKNISTPLVTDFQIKRVFSHEPASQIAVQLSRWENRGEMKRVKRGLYQFSQREVDELVVAGWIYSPSYISMESALHIYGLIPDVTQQITSITPITTKKYVTQRGVFTFSKIKQELFFGFESAQDETSDLSYNIATPAKALLDYLYVRKIKSLDESRIDLSFFEKKSERNKLRKYSEQYPHWVLKLVESVYE